MTNALIALGVYAVAATTCITVFISRGVLHRAGPDPADSLTEGSKQ